MTNQVERIYDIDGDDKKMPADLFMFRSDGLKWRMQN
jgi:hypothetical protein